MITSSPKSADLEKTERGFLLETVEKAEECEVPEMGSFESLEKK